MKLFKNTNISSSYVNRKLCVTIGISLKCAHASIRSLQQVTLLTPQSDSVCLLLPKRNNTAFQYRSPGEPPLKRFTAKSSSLWSTLTVKNTEWKILQDSYLSVTGCLMASWESFKAARTSLNIRNWVKRPRTVTILRFGSSFLNQPNSTTSTPQCTYCEIQMETNTSFLLNSTCNCHGKPNLPLSC